MNLEKKKSNVDDQTRILSSQIQIIFDKERFVNEQYKVLEKKLIQVSKMTEEDARKKLFSKVREDIEDELSILCSKRMKDFKEKIHSEVTKIICSSLERYSTEITLTKNVDYLTVEDKKTVSRIIGKEGRNITFFRQLTGTDIIIDKERKGSKKNSDIVIEISSFDSLRREIALQTLKKMIANEQKITPIFIERIYEETAFQMDNFILETGENIFNELNISDFSKDLAKYLGRLKYRTSYGQNVLQHSLEVAKISGTIAAEIGLNPKIAKRAGLLHDIGKATEDLVGYSHVTSGIMLAKRYNESEIIINAIASHHDRTLANNPYSLIVAAADTLSAARPGARSNQLESYISRMKGLEGIENDFNEVKKIYSFQAGREIWVIVDSNKVNDLQFFELSKKIRTKIQEKIIIPGDVIISFIREKKIVEKITNSGRSFNPKTNVS